MNAPCKGCPDRTENGSCHASCGAYLAFRAKLDAQRAAKTTESPFVEYARDKATKKIRRSNWTRRRKR